jgi:hypothetical protein
MTSADLDTAPVDHVNPGEEAEAAFPFEGGDGSDDKRSGCDGKNSPIAFDRPARLVADAVQHPSRATHRERALGLLDCISPKSIAEQATKHPLVGSRFR